MALLWWGCGDEPHKDLNHPGTQAEGGGLFDWESLAQFEIDPPNETADTTLPIEGPPMVGGGVTCAPEGVWPLGAGSLTTVILDLETAPDAVCNDGSPGAYAIRPGGNDWLVFLDGGAGCKNYGECLDRWCGSGIYDSTDMSTGSIPDSLAVGGMLSASPSNPLAGFTTVYVHYCSSDLWVGDADANVRLEDTGDSGDSTDYAIRFNGNDILMATLDELLSAERRTELQGLPAASEIRQFVLAGGSAGALGAIYHGDEVAERVRAVAPAADVRLALTAGLASGVQASDDPWGEAVPGPLLDGLLGLVGYADRASESFGPRKWNAQGDASCLFAHPSEPWWCADSTHVLLNEVATPFFVAQDQHDLVWFSMMDDVIEGDGPFAGAYTGEMYEADIRNLAVATQQVIDPNVPSEYPESGPLPGVFSPRCHLHDDYARNGFAFQYLEVPTLPEGPPLAFSELLANWLSGAEPTWGLVEAEGEVDCAGPIP